MSKPRDFLAGGFRGRGGFTLVELLVAMAVFSLGILGVLGMQMFAIRGNAFAWNATIAENMAMQKLEYLKSIGYVNVKGAIDTALDDPSVDDTFFGTLTEGAAQDAVPDPEDKFPASQIGADDQVVVDFEDYGAVKKDPATFYEDNDSNGAPDAPFDRFRRVTIMKIVDEATGKDNRMVVRVIVYWQGVGGVHKTLMMGMVAL